MNDTDTSSRYVGWRTVQQRGTIDILYSCFGTLLICVYTALHMNIPLWNTRRSLVLLRHAAWIAVGVFAPEVVVLAAVSQSRAARKVQRKIEDVCPKDTLDGYGGQKWCQKFSYFCEMGGYQFILDESLNSEDTHGQDSNSSPNTRAIYLTSPCIIHLLEIGDLTPLTLFELEDRSKASSLAKALSAVQASWLVLQVIARAAQNLPTTELEVHVIAHILCALTSWASWLRKPLNVCYPELIQPDSKAGISIVRDYVLRSVGTSQFLTTFRHNSQSLVVLRRYPTRVDLHAHLSHETNARFVVLLPEYSIASLETMACTFTDVYGLRLPPVLVVCRRSWDNDTIPHSRGENAIRTNAGEVVFEVVKVNELAWTFHMHVWADGNICDIIDSHLKTHRDGMHNVELFTTSLSMVSDFPLDSKDGRIALAVHGTLVLCYGAIHLALWNAYFPTSFEKWLWRLSSVAICILPEFFGMLFLFDELECSPTVMVEASIILCAFASLFFLMLSFFSLRSQPIEVYHQVNWTQWLPHI